VHGRRRPGRGVGQAQVRAGCQNSQRVLPSGRRRTHLIRGRPVGGAEPGGDLFASRAVHRHWPRRHRGAGGLISSTSRVSSRPAAGRFRSGAELAGQERCQLVGVARGGQHPDERVPPAGGARSRLLRQARRCHRTQRVFAASQGAGRELGGLAGRSPKRTGARITTRRRPEHGHRPGRRPGWRMIPLGALHPHRQHHPVELATGSLRASPGRRGFQVGGRLGGGSGAWSRAEGFPHDRLPVAARSLQEAMLPTQASQCDPGRKLRWVSPWSRQQLCSKAAGVLLVPPGGHQPGSIAPAAQQRRCAGAAWVGALAGRRPDRRACGRCTTQSKVEIELRGPQGTSRWRPKPRLTKASASRTSRSSGSARIAVFCRAAPLAARSHQQHRIEQTAAGPGGPPTGAVRNSGDQRVSATAQAHPSRIASS